MADGSEPAKISDPAVMRALAHPARLAILDYLSYSETGATATQCAEIVGLSPSATSYHLRALAKVGMIEEAPSRGDGRERVWRAKYHNYSVGGGREADAEAIAAETQLAQAFLARENDRVMRYLSTIRQEPEEWIELGTISNSKLVMTADELKDLFKSITELLEPFGRRTRKKIPDAARGVAVQMRIFPED